MFLLNLKIRLQIFLVGVSLLGIGSSAYGDTRTSLEQGLKRKGIIKYTSRERLLMDYKDMVTNRPISNVMEVLGPPINEYKMPNGKMLYTFYTVGVCKAHMTVGRSKVENVSFSSDCY